MSNDYDEGFLARWSKRKVEARRGPAESVAPGAEAAEGADAPTAAELEPEFDVTTLPDIETLSAETDITGFLKRGVPAELQRHALRKMWQLDPEISTFIEVAENQYDFNTPGSIPGFGELDPGTDIKALLAHAMGETPAAEPEPAALVAPAEVASPSSEPVEIAIAGPETEHATAAVDTGADPVTAAPPAPQPSPPKARRHGGALPA